MEMALPCPSICLEAFRQYNVLLNFYSAEKLHAIENLFRKDNLQALKPENSVTYFCTSLQ